jgi:DNA primase
MKDPKVVRELINENVSLHDILESVDVHLRQVLRPEQMSCPFHGADTSMSARYYPETNSMYCFACKKSWDPIGFWMQYAEVRFMEAARHLASKYNVDLSKVADIQQLQLKRFYLEKGKNQIDKRKMALYVLEQKLRMVLPLEDISVAGKMLYLTAMARHTEDQAQFTKLTYPVAKKIRAALT